MRTISLVFLVSLGLIAMDASIAAVDAAGGVPPGQRMAAGADFTCAITDVGSVRCWGANGVGALGDGTRVDRELPTPVIGIDEPVVSIVAGDDFACALTSSGGVKCWGWNTHGQLGNGSTEISTTAVDVVGLSSGVIAISAGYRHTCAVTSAGLRCWGRNSSGQLGDGTTTDSLVPVLAQVGPVLDVATGILHTCVLTTSHGVRCWGQGFFGQLGDGLGDRSLIPVDVVGLPGPVSRIAAGDYRSCAVLSETGSLKCWGANWKGELGDGTTQDRLVPVDVISLQTGVTAVHTGKQHTCAVQNGAAKCWGFNDTGRLGDGGRTDSLIPVDVVGLSTGVQQIVAGVTQSCAWKDADSFYCWGSNIYGQIGNGLKGYSSYPQQVIGLGAQVDAVKVGTNHACALENGGVFCWGDNRHGQLGDGSHITRNTPAPVDGLEANVVAISVNDNHGCALTQSGIAKCWGENDVGQLGDGTMTERPSPVAVLGLGGGLLQLETSLGHSCALTATHGVKCWGWNTEGQLGDGTTESRLMPVDVVDLTSGVQAISVGASRTCAILNTSSVRCWGVVYIQDMPDYADIQLIPVEIPEFGNTVTSIDANWNDCFVSLGGILKCRGQNDSGQLGDGGTNSSGIPVVVSGFSSGAISVSNGRNHECALDIGGAAYCWGNNAFGKLGDGSREYYRYVPTAVSGLVSGVSSISAGPYGTCVALASGEAKCWGRNLYGQSGTGESGSVLEPTQVLINEEVFRSGFGASGLLH